MKRLALTEWAKKEGISYKKAHYHFRHNKIPHETGEESGRLYVYESEKPVISGSKQNYMEFGESFQGLTQELRANVSQSGGGSTAYRRNRAGSITHKTDKYKHIENGATPFFNDDNGYVDISDIIELCQKAHYNFAIFRETIELLTEFSTNPINFKGSNKKANKFFEEWADYINILSLQNKFFREYFRSGNVFIEKINSNITLDNVSELNKTFNSLLTTGVELPSKYVILNPVGVKAKGMLNFASPEFYKQLTPYDIESIRSPKTDQDRAIADSIKKNHPEEYKKIMIDKSGSTSVLIKLDPDNVCAVFYKKQDYEPFAIPMGFPVLEDINAKAELKKIDMAVARTMQQVILLITVGETIDNEPYINPDSMGAIKSIFQQESVGRVLVADYTVDGKFIIPDIADVLTPEKYKVIENDIKIGLNNILIGSDEKFSNQSIKIDIFLERLKEARMIFINDFLKPEVKRISKLMRFKSTPKVQFEDFKFKNNLEYARLYTRLGELNILTPEEVLEAIQTDNLPLPSESIENQKKFKKLRDDEELYIPTNMNNKDGENSEAGRPAGSPNKQKTTNRAPRVQQMAERDKRFNLEAVQDTIRKFNNLSESIKEFYKDKNLDRNALRDIAENIAIYNEKEEWESAVGKSIIIQDINPEISKIADEFDLVDFQAAILYHSKHESGNS